MRTKKVFYLEKSANEAGEILGFDWIKQFDYPDNQLDCVPLLEIIKAIESVKLNFKTRFSVYAYRQT